jgi:hypothetical protein
LPAAVGAGPRTLHHRSVTAKTRTHAHDRHKGVAMSYRDFLVEMQRRAEEQSPEPQVVDYLEHRNAEALRAWQQRRFDYERRRLAHAAPAPTAAPTLQ